MEVPKKLSFQANEDVFPLSAVQPEFSPPYQIYDGLYFF
ncbi:Uncharacterized protein dnm_048450 [Desulfonema magnum]|uniref:Uncharacterized protein n=1 Tax=Desulfonema magnum TaxID=45655 RepID=A0A975GQC3_9BACT|nr:Uncharacterized protein dnm_048450 [Desulfonema magnum]